MEGGPPCFPQTHRGSWYSGTWLLGGRLSLRDSHPLGCRVPTASRRLPPGHVPGPTTPTVSKNSGFGLLPFRSPLLRESRLMSSRRATEMFQFARGPPLGLSLQPRVSRHDSGWVAPFGFSGLTARMQLPLNVSPVSASFIGLQRRGIHLVLSLACFSTFAHLLFHTRIYRASRGVTCKHTSKFPLSLCSRFLPSAKLK